MKYLSILLLMVFLFTGYTEIKVIPIENKKYSDGKFSLGNENLLNKGSEQLLNKRIGLITNKSGVTSDGTLFLDELSKKFSVTKIFTPEHGLRGDDRDENYTDDVTGISVISLYGNKKKPDANEIADVDIFVYDIQDVGARFYTFINTMFFCIESAVENNKEFIVCDRPIMPDGSYVDGFMLDESLSSFVGMIYIPIAYGMTCGELAQYINAEYFNGTCNLRISKMENYFHNTDYESLNLPWVKPSPNLYFPSSALCYLGTCLFEGTNFSEGRGTDKPFEYVGAPYCDGDILAEEMNSYNFNGVNFESINFIPTSVTSPSNPPKYVGEQCSGVYLNVNNKKIFEPVKVGIALIVSLRKLFPQFEIKNNNFIDKLAGTTDLRVMVNNGSSYNEIIDSYSISLTEFYKTREKYLLY